MEENILKPSTIALQLLILVFAFCLVYFTFVYYPNLVRERKFAVSFKVPFVEKAAVGSDGFPVVTPDYRITYEKGSKLYYVFVQGDSLDKYVDNKAAAQLSLKNTLSSESLCDQKVIYTSVAKLGLPDDYRSTSHCN